MKFSRCALVKDRAIPLESVTFECADDFIGGTGLLPGWVDILDTEEPAAATRPCSEVTRNRGKQGPEVQGPGG